MMRELNQKDVQKLTDENTALQVQIRALSEKTKNLTAALDEARQGALPMML